ncbi:MAG: ASCH domain-containing protein [Acidobacteria bacterium]|nr:ASCH domain-containing protein [Acidobacteriota bacterium]
MLFRQPFFAGLAEGRITVAFRQWRRPGVKAGGTLITPAGQLAIDSVEPVEASELQEDDALRAGFASLAELRRDLRAQRPGMLYRIGFHYLGEDPRLALRESLPEDEAGMLEILRRLARLDAASSTGPWTKAVLQLINQHPARRAGDLAAMLANGLDPLAFKLNVRKLKNLGLTESLGTGYRLSPRGAAVLERLA